MMRSEITSVALSIFLLMNQNAIGESQPSRLQPLLKSEPVESKDDRAIDDHPIQARPQSAATRKLTSVPSSSLRVGRYRSRFSRRRNVELRVSALGGISKVSGFSEVQGQRFASDPFQNISLGGAMDLRVWRYFGAEVEGYYALDSKESTTALSGEAQTSTRSMYGGLLNAKFQVPFYTGFLKWIPRAGVGYGLVRSREITESELQGTVATTQFRGPYATLGVDVEVIQLIVYGDYARSLASQGEIVSDDGVNSVTQTVDAPSFDRIRVGVNFRVARHFTIGGAYIRRGVGFSINTDSFGSPLTINAATFQHQFLGLLMYEL